jgi:hypothetical protein
MPTKLPLKSVAISRNCSRAAFEIVDDFLGENVRIGEIVRLFEVLVSEPARRRRPGKNS